MAYRVAFQKQAVKFLSKKLPRRISQKVLAKIKALSENPYTGNLDIKKLSFFKNLEKAYRLRIGNIRVIYEVDPQTKRITIYLIDFRRTTTY